jgi:protein-disulfide isomerase
MRKIWVMLLGVVSFFFLQTGFVTTAGPNPVVADAQTVLQIGQDDRVLGNRGAPITIVEYASLGCPHCAHFTNDVLPEIKKAWIDTGKAKLVLRDFPLDQPSLRAAMIARCAPPDRFYAFADTFFASQDQWAGGTKDYREALARLAKFGGMGKDEFEACLNNTALENRIVEQRLIASQQLDVNATPTFFINGSKFSGAPTAEEFNKVLSNLVAKS